MIDPRYVLIYFFVITVGYMFIIKSKKLLTYSISNTHRRWSEEFKIDWPFRLLMILIAVGIYYVTFTWPVNWEARILFGIGGTAAAFVGIAANFFLSKIEALTHNLFSTVLILIMLIGLWVTGYWQPFLNFAYLAIFMFMLPMENRTTWIELLGVTTIVGGLADVIY